jgi:hypothetical protein
LKRRTAATIQATDLEKPVKEVGPRIAGGYLRF